MKDWWGFSNSVGWIYIDREIKCNKPGSEMMVFVKCAENLAFFESKDNWINNYKFYKNCIHRSEEFEIFNRFLEKRDHFNKISKDFFLKNEKSLNLNYDVFLGKIDIEEKNKIAFEKHQNFLKKRGLNNSGVIKSSKNKIHRVTHCWNCTKTLDNNIDIECKSCGWIICMCGACGCGYSHW